MDPNIARKVSTYVANNFRAMQFKKEFIILEVKLERVN